MTETHEDRVKILEDAPKDGKATHVSVIDPDGVNILNYLDDDNGRWFSEINGWTNGVGLNENKRSLSDIRQLVDMQKEIDELKEIENKFAHLMCSSEFKELVYHNPDFLDKLKSGV
jgi:hypothetical protein